MIPLALAAVFTPLRCAVAVSALVFLTGGYWYAYKQGEKAKDAEFTAYKLETSRQSQINYDKVRGSEDVLRAVTVLAKDRENAQTKAINAGIERIAKQLRDRPERPTASAASVPASGATGASGGSCTGAQLYKQDGEFLARESAIASRLQAKLATCQSKYNSLAEQLEKLNKNQVIRN